MNHGLTQETVAKICAVFAHHAEIEKVLLYGSRAKGGHHPGSDIDLAIIGRNLEHALLGRIDDELDDLLLPYRFDLSIFSKISHPDLLEHIRRVGVTFYEQTPVELKH